METTDLKCEFGNTEYSLCYRVELKKGQDSVIFHMGELTSANTVPSRIPFPKALSIDPLISGVYPLFNSSSSWSDERRDSAYTEIVSQPRRIVVKQRTVGFAENWNSRGT